MTSSIKATVAALVIAPLFAFSSSAAEPSAHTSPSLELSKPLAAQTMFFADRYATAYYTIDNENFRTVVTVAPGPEGQGNPMQFVNSLSDGESAEYSVGGYGQNAIKVKLQLHRDGDSVKAHVTTELPKTAS